jgi:hypothetical protein
LDFGPNQSKIRNPKSKMGVSVISAFALLVPPDLHNLALPIGAGGAIIQ